MIDIRFNIYDLSVFCDINSYLYVENARYVPLVGDIISLSNKQTQELQERIVKSSYLKKYYMKFIFKRGVKPLLKSEYKDLTPAQIRKKMDKEWSFYLYPGELKVVSRQCLILESKTIVTLNVALADREVPYVQLDDETEMTSGFRGCYNCIRDVFHMVDDLQVTVNSIEERLNNK